LLEKLGVNTSKQLERSLLPVVTFEQHVDKWIADVRAEHAAGKYARVKPSTFRDYKSRIRKHLNPRYATTPTDEIEQSHADRLIDDMATSGYSKSTIKNTVVCLGVVLGRSFQTKMKLRKLKCASPGTLKF
jgi:hypothetical protein